MFRRVCERVAAGIAPDVIIALGGGSVIDSAKFLAAGHAQFEPVLQYLETGERSTQLSLNRDDLYAEAAVIDPEVTQGSLMPSRCPSAHELDI